MAVMTVEAAPAAAETLAAKTICLVLRKGRFGNSKMCSLAEVEVDADKKLLRMTKTLVDSPELVKVAQLDGMVDSLLKKRAFTSMFKGGVHLVSVMQVDEVETLLTEKAAERKALVDAACAAFVQRTAETSERLGVMHVATDYPSLDRFKESFFFEWQWVTFDTPSKLKAISKALFEKERQKAASKLSAVATECQQAMRAGLAQLVDHLVERLTPGDDGKPKKFSKTLIGNLNEFLTTFELRDVTDDTELGELVKKARAVMAGVDPKLLRSDDLARQKVVDEFSALQAQLEPMVIEPGTRKISLTDEVDEEPPI